MCKHINSQEHENVSIKPFHASTYSSKLPVRVRSPHTNNWTYLPTTCFESLPLSCDLLFGGNRQKSECQANGLSVPAILRVYWAKRLCGLPILLRETGGCVSPHGASQVVFEKTRRLHQRNDVANWKRFAGYNLRLFLTQKPNKCRTGLIIPVMIVVHFDVAGPVPQAQFELSWKHFKERRL